MNSRNEGDSVVREQHTWGRFYSALSGEMEWKWSSWAKKMRANKQFGILSCPFLSTTILRKLLRTYEDYESRKFQSGKGMENENLFTAAEFCCFSKWNFSVENTKKKLSYLLDNYFCVVISFAGDASCPKGSWSSDEKYRRLRTRRTGQKKITKIGYEETRTFPRTFTTFLDICVRVKSQKYKNIFPNSILLFLYEKLMEMKSQEHPVPCISECGLENFMRIKTSWIFLWTFPTNIRKFQRI